MRERLDGMRLKVAGAVTHIDELNPLRRFRKRKNIEITVSSAAYHLREASWLIFGSREGISEKDISELLDFQLHALQMGKEGLFDEMLRQNDGRLNVDIYKLLIADYNEKIRIHEEAQKLDTPGGRFEACLIFRGRQLELEGRRHRDMPEYQVKNQLRACGRAIEIIMS